MESVSRISSLMDPGESRAMDPSWRQFADPAQARDLTVEAAQAMGMGLSKVIKGGGSSSRNIPFAKLKALLDSRSDRDILEGLKKVIAVSGMRTRRQLATPLSISISMRRSPR